MKQALRDVAALVARVGVGGIFFANGWTKLEDGLTATGAKFLQQGAPAPGAWATVTMLTELIGGALLIAGLGVAVTGLILFAEALGVFLVAPPLNPISMNELILLGAAAILLAVVGAGRLSVDHMVVIRRRETEAANEFAADAEADRVIASLRDADAPARQSRPAEDADPPARQSKPAEDAVPPARRSRPAEDAVPEEAGQQAGDAPSPMTDTMPHPRTRTRPAGPPATEEPAPAPVPGDTLVAGRKKPAPRGRRPSADG
ncbi:DoxX family membrane protein [Nonomuraea sp. NPDC050227]|uniref:DoxX family membrane protein n=1 Tax=Nonomuraea sp. NPDC050227 TaxID=3364360 RepID=UPI0037BAD6FC